MTSHLIALSLFLVGVIAAGTVAVAAFRSGHRSLAAKSAGIAAGWSLLYFLGVLRFVVAAVFFVIHAIVLFTVLAVLVVVAGAAWKIRARRVDPAPADPGA